MNAEAIGSVLDALEAGNPEAAYLLGTQALLVDPEDASLWGVCGIAARLCDRVDDAERCWRTSLSLRSDVRVTRQLASLLLALNRGSEAMTFYQAAADDGSADALCLTNLSVLRRGGGDDLGAEQALRQALALEPGNTAAWVGLGVLLASAKRLFEAEGAYRHALDIQPDEVAALTNLGLVLEEQHRFAEAETFQRHALALAPDIAEVHNHLAGVLSRRQSPDHRYEAEAEFHYREAIRLQPDDARNHSNLGGLLFSLGRDEEAEQALRAALARDPELVSAHTNLGHVLLAMGRLPEGFRHAEMRYHSRATSSLAGFPRQLSADVAQKWAGQPLAGKRLLVWPEQGHGDQVQFSRYLPLVREQHQPAWITNACTESMLALMKSSSGADRHIQLKDAPAALSEHDYWVPLMSLPLYCGTTLSNIPGATPYLFADPMEVVRWAPRIPDSPLRVGLVWRGNANHDNDADRSILDLAVLEPLWQIPDIAFVSLQKWAGEEQARNPPKNQQPLVHLGSDIQTFSDSAAILTQLDLLISVDTAACHLAGALGTPCWVMLPAYRNDWRWLRGITDSPWYPHTRLFQQPERGDWTSVVEQVRQALSHFSSTRS